MEIKKQSILASTLIAGALIGSANLNANESSLFGFNELGSGSEVRTTLATNSITEQAGILSFDLKCGEGTQTEDKKASDSKTTEAKCGEGKCGEGKGEKKAKTSTTDKKSESKSKEAKCGEGKCGK